MSNMMNLANNEGIQIVQNTFHSKKVKYQLLDKLFKPYKGSFERGGTINIYIDINSLLKSFYNPTTIDLFNSFNNNDSKIFTSEIFNIIGHYRHYFARYHEMYTTFYLFNSFDKSSYHLSISEDYKENFYEKRLDENSTTNILNKIIENEFKLISRIINYVPNTYYINTNKLDPSSIPYYIINYKENKMNEINLVISNDILQYQLLGSDISNILILELRGEKTKLISNFNVIDELVKSTKPKNLDENSYKDFSPDLLNILYGLISNKDYNISGVKRMGVLRGIKFILEKINSNKLFPRKYFPTDDIQLFDDVKDNDKFLNNLKLIDFCNNIETNIDKYDKIQFLDLIDYQGFRLFNDEIMSRFPIMLNFVFEGEGNEPGNEIN